MTERRDDEEPVVIRDRRRIDPETGEVRAPEGDAPPAPAVDAANLAAAELAAQVAERTADLQRITAEYANYRRRVDRDREAVLVSARMQFVGDLLTVLDDIDRADAHGDLTGPFKAVADKITSVVQKLGLESFGLVGEPFDPSVHEAVQHSTSPDVDGPTVTAVLRRGYKFGDRLVRAALVAVTDHEPAEVVEAEVVADTNPANEWFEPPRDDAKPES